MAGAAAPHRTAARDDPTQPRFPGAACHRLSAHGPTVRGVSTATRWETQRSFDELGRPLRDITFTVVDLETTGGSPRRRLHDHRDRRRQGPRRRGARRVPDPGQPAHPDPALHRGAHRHHQRHGGRRPADRVRTAGVPRVRRRHRPGGPQRAVRRRLPQALRRAAGPGLAGVRGRRHRQAGPPGHHPRRRPQLQALVAGPRLPLGHDPQPPGARRRPGHRRRAARADGAPRRPGRAHARGAPDVLGPGLHRPAPQAAPGRGAAALARRLPVPRRRPPGPLRRHLARPPDPGALLLHRLRDPVPDGRDGRAGHHRPGHRLQHRPRGAGSRAAPDRRAQAALQPALAVPRADALHQADPRAVAAALAGDPGARATTPTTSARSPPARPPRSAWPPCTTPSRCASAPTGSARCPSRSPVRAGRARPLPLTVRRQRRPHDLRRGGAAAPGHAAAPARRGGRGDQPADGPSSPPTSGSRRPASTATGWRRSCAPPPAPSG